MKRTLLAICMTVCVLMAGKSRAQAPYTTVTGVLQSANGQPAKNTILSFTPTQTFFIPGTNTTQQVGNLYVAGAPVGTCLVSGQLYTDTNTLYVYQCQYGVWVKVSSGGGGATFPSISNIVVNTSTTNSRNANQGDINPFFLSPGPIGATSPNAISATMLGATSRTLTSGVANCGLTGPLFFTTCDQTSFTSYNSGAVLQTGSNLTLNSYGTGGGSGGPTMVEGKYTVAHSDNDLFADAGGGQSYSINATKYGVGDFLLNNWNWFNAAGCAYASDQCSQGLFMNGGQIYGYPHMTIATGGAGSQSPTFTAYPTGCGAVVFACLPEPGSRLIDITQGGPNRYFSGASVPFSGTSISYLRQLPTTGGAGALPIASAWGYQSAANINPGGLFSSPVTETVTIATGSGSFTTGKVCVVGNNWVEQSNITGVTGSAGAQTITLPLGRPNVSLFLIQGSHTCDLLSFDATFNLTGTRSSYVAVGSIDGTNLIYASEGFSSVGMTTLPQAGAEPETTAGTGDPNSQFHTYCAARIWQDVTIGAPPTVALEPNSCNFATADAVEVPDFDIQEQQAMQILVNQNGPSGANTHMNGLSVYISGMGAAGGGTGYEVTNNQSNLAWYTQGGGNLTEPNCAFCVSGYWNYGRVFNTAPATALDYVVNLQAGQTSLDWTRNPLAGPVTITSGLFNFKNAALQVQNGGTFGGLLYGAGLIASGTNGVNNGQDTSGLAINFFTGTGLTASYLTACSLYPYGSGQTNKVCLSDNVRSTAAVTPNRDFYAGNLGGLTTVYTGTGGVFGFASGMPFTPSCDTGVSRISAGVWGFGNCTPNDISATIKAAIGTFGTSATVAGSAVCTVATGCGGTMVYPGAGIANSTGSAWGTSYTTTGTGTVVALQTSPAFTTPSLGVATATSINLLPLRTTTTGLGEGTSIGIGALPNSTTGDQSTAVGFNVLTSQTTGYGNTGVGVAALGSMTTGYENAAFGHGAGYNSGTSLTAITQSVFVGSGASSTTDGLTNVDVIGYGAQATASNQVTLGNSSITSTILRGAVTGPTSIAAGQFTGTTTGSGSSSISLPNNTGSIAALPANSGGFAGPASGGTAYLYKLPATVTQGLLWQATPATNEGVNESALSTATAAQVSSVIQGLTGCNTATYVFTPQANDCVAPGGSTFPDITDSSGTVGINNATASGTTTVNIGTANTTATSNAAFTFGNATALTNGATSAVTLYTDSSNGFNVYGPYGALFNVSNNGGIVAHQYLTAYGSVNLNGGLAFAGTTFSVTGCGTATSLTGGQLGGKFTAASATCTPVVTTGVTAAHGFSCWMNDQTTPAVRFTETASTTTTATFTATGTLGSTDTINFGCVEY